MYEALRRVATCQKCIMYSCIFKKNAITLLDQYDLACTLPLFNLYAA